MKKNTWIFGKRVVSAILAASLTTSIPLVSFGAGWQKIGSGQWSYQNEDETYLAGGFTPDGYYIDTSGIWRESVSILGVEYPNRNSFLAPDDAGSFLEWERTMTTTMDHIVKDLKDIRGIELQSDQVGVYSVSNNAAKKLFDFYKSTDKESYMLRLSCPLSKIQSGTSTLTSTISGRTSTEKVTTYNAAWYDYQVLAGLMCRISRTGVILADAIYSSWEEENVYGLKLGQWVPVGDALIRYEVSGGAGVYQIKANPDL